MYCGANVESDADQQAHPLPPIAGQIDVPATANDPSHNHMSQKEKDLAGVPYLKNKTKAESPIPNEEIEEAGAATKEKGKIYKDQDSASVEVGVRNVCPIVTIGSCFLPFFLPLAVLLNR